MILTVLVRWQRFTSARSFDLLPIGSEGQAIAVTLLDREAFIQFCKDDNVVSNNDCAERRLCEDGETACLSAPPIVAAQW